MAFEWLSPAATLLAALGGTVGGGFLVHHFTLAREVAAARRSQRVDYLISAYRRLVDASNRDGGASEEQWRAVEDALGDVVLLGDAEEVEAARAFIEALATQGSASLDRVLDALRTSLRQELTLADVPRPNPFILRHIPHAAIPQWPAATVAPSRETGSSPRDLT